MNKKAMRLRRTLISRRAKETASPGRKHLTAWQASDQFRDAARQRGLEHWRRVRERLGWNVARHEHAGSPDGLIDQLPDSLTEGDE